VTGEKEEVMAQFFRALAHPLRLKIIEFLRGGERCVCEIVPALGGEQSAISKHLGVLRQAGILTSRKEGTSVFYRLRDPLIWDIYEKAQKAMEGCIQELGEIIKK